MELSSILGLPLGLMTGAQFLTLIAEAFRYRSQMEPEKSKPKVESKPKPLPHEQRSRLTPGEPLAHRPNGR